MEHFRRYFLDPVTQKYADFSGRASRSQYWYFVLYFVLLSLVMATIDTFVINPMLGATLAQASQGGFLQIIFALALFLPSLSIGARRLHDIGRSGWWLLLIFVPIIGALILLYWFTLKSQPENNKYGVRPKEEQ